MSEKVLCNNKDVVESFAAMDENRFTCTVLLPLLRALGWEKIEFRGGATERGRDLILEKKSEFGVTEVTVAVVKKFSGTARAADRDACQTAVLQLQMARQVSITDLQGQPRLPHRMLLCSPLPIADSEIDAIQMHLREEDVRRTRILDGARIAQLVVDKCPQVISNLQSPEWLLRNHSLTTSTIAITSQYYRVVSPKKIGDYYVGLKSGFGSGRKTFRLRVHESFELSIGHRNCSELLLMDAICASRFGIRFVKDDRETASRNVAVLNSLKKQLQSQIENIAELESKGLETNRLADFSKIFVETIESVDGEIANHRKRKLPIDHLVDTQRRLRSLDKSMESFFTRGFDLTTEAWLVYATNRGQRDIGREHNSLKTIAEFNADLEIVSKHLPSDCDLQRCVAFELERRITIARIDREKKTNTRK
jgi:hypothetical protein